MAKIDLTSNEWRELIFQDRNKEFGAFKMRSESESRHNLAMLIVVAFVIVGLSIPKFLNLEKSNQQEDKLGVVDLMQINHPETEKEIEREVKPIAPPLPEFAKSIRFIVPVIMDDVADLNESEGIPSQSVLNNSDAVVSTVSEEGSANGTILKSEWREEQAGSLDGNEVVYTSIEQMAQFPGGESELLKYISKNLIYPAKDLENNVQGKVVLRFVVSKTGLVNNVEIIRSLTPTSDNEAIRVVRSLPRFIPGKQNGVNVSVWYILPISYKLEFN